MYDDILIILNLPTLQSRRQFTDDIFLISAFKTKLRCSSFLTLFVYVHLPGLSETWKLFLFMAPDVFLRQMFDEHAPIFLADSYFIELILLLLLLTPVIILHVFGSYSSCYLPYSVSSIMFFVCFLFFAPVCSHFCTNIL
jgi:hypothetical protein